MSTTFFPIRFKTFVQLPPKEVTESFEERLLEKLRVTYEGVCSRYGYIRPGSLRVLQRSAGQLMKPHFNGFVRFEVVLSADVCNPTAGTVVEATVKARNHLGLLAESRTGDAPVLDIIVPKRSAGIASEIDLDAVELRDVIFVEVMGKRYQLNDTKISIIGRAVKEMRAPEPPSDALDDEDGSHRGGAADEEEETDEEDSDAEDNETDGDGSEDKRGEAEAMRAAKQEYSKLIQLQQKEEAVADDDAADTDTDVGEEDWSEEEDLDGADD
jgi:DNA-directed RNA polymerase subunit E'/Rpb7